MSVLENINEILFLLPLLQEALSNNNVELALNTFGKINPLLLDLSLLINAPDNSNLDNLLHRLVEICAVLSQCLREIDGFVCNEEQLSAVRSIRDTLLDIRPMVREFPEETLIQRLEDFFSNGNGYFRTVAIATFYIALCAAAASAGILISEDISDIITY